MKAFCFFIINMFNINDWQDMIHVNPESGDRFGVLISCRLHQSRFKPHHFGGIFVRCVSPIENSYLRSIYFYIMFLLCLSHIPVLYNRTTAFIFFH